MNECPVLPDFTRWQWAGSTERAWFRGQFQEASNAFIELERLSVVEGIRKAAFQFVPLTQVSQATEWAHQHGLVLVPIAAVHQSGVYSTTPTSGEPNTLRVVYVRPEHYSDVLPFTNDSRVGEFLGFPKCCRDAFAASWGQGSVDSTYLQVQQSADGPCEASTLLRWMGIRLVPHMPCSYQCEQSAELGRQFAALGNKYGYADEMAFIREALSFPVYGSRLFGISQLITPPLKLVVRSDWTPKKEQFYRTGSYVAPQETWWTDNGFSDPDAMRAAHKLLLNSVLETLPPGARVLDLGCGNGLLMRRLKSVRPDIRIAGVEADEIVVKRIPPLSGKWWAERIESCVWESWSADVAFINPVRLTEMTPEDAAKTRTALRKIPTLVGYGYSDCSSRLEALTADAGLGNIRLLTKLPTLSAGLIS